MKLTAKQLFLVDGLGALLSAFFLGVILVQFETYFGMPAKVLYVLSALAGVYALYSLSCYFFLNTTWGPYLRIIAAANLLHCGLTIVLLVRHFDQIEPLGWLYFLGEIGIVSFLAIEEWKTSAKATDFKESPSNL